MFLKRHDSKKPFPVIPKANKKVSKSSVDATKPQPQTQQRANYDYNVHEPEAIPEGWEDIQVIPWGNDPADAIDAYGKDFGTVFVEIVPVGYMGGGSYYNIRDNTTGRTLYTTQIDQDSRTGKQVGQIFKTDMEAVRDAEQKVKGILKKQGQGMTRRNLQS